jgi:hypothetical protein
MPSTAALVKDTFSASTGKENLVYKEIFCCVSEVQKAIISERLKKVRIFSWFKRLSFHILLTHLLTISVL